MLSGCTNRNSYNTVSINSIIHLAGLSYKQGCVENSGKDCDRKSEEYETKIRNSINH